MNKFITSLAFATAAVGISATAYALPTLRIFDGTTTITITDNLAGDSSPAAGQVTWIGSIGVWNFNIHVGTTFPILGSLTNPYMDISFNATSISAASSNALMLSFSNDGFGATNSRSQVALGGTTAGTVNYTTFGGTNNTLFSTVNLLSTQGPFTGAFSGTSQTAVINSSLYSLTQVLTVTHGAGTQQSTGDALLSSVPDAANTLLLLVGGLTTLGLINRRRKIAS